jgi:hypothetical protein
MAGQPITRKKKEIAKQRAAERAANGGKRRVHKPTPPEKVAAKKNAAKDAAARGEELDFAGYTHDTWKLFMDEYMSTGRQDLACKKSGIPRQTVYRRTRQDVEFCEAMREAREICMETLEDAAIRRGRDGWLEPQYTRSGELAGNVRKYSDTLLMFMLTNGRPDKYRPQRNGDEELKTRNTEAVINLTLTRSE